MMTKYPAWGSTVISPVELCVLPALFGDEKDSEGVSVGGAAGDCEEYMVQPDRIMNIKSTTRIVGNRFFIAYGIFLGK